MTPGRGARSWLAVAAGAGVAAIGLGAWCGGTRSPPAVPEPPGRFVDTVAATQFHRGNIHTHTDRTDGDSPPEDVYAWYQDHGYAFLAITDHNTLTDPALFEERRRPGFITLRGEEVTMTSRGKPVHVNALCTRSVIGGGPSDFPDPGAALRWAVAQVAAQGGVALVNHPNFEWALGADDLPSARGAHLIEIWSGHPHVRPAGDAFHPSSESLWDGALAAGLDFAPAAVDDMHHLAPTALDPASRPGRAFVEVFAPEASEAAVCEALRDGRLYASNGVRLAALAVEGDVFKVRTVEPARVELVGQGGSVLATVALEAGAEATYTLRGGERWVRARITDAAGRRAWTRAYRVVPR
jgi:hypothetical protein